MKLMSGISLYPLPGIHLVFTPSSKLSLSGMCPPDLQPPPMHLGAPILLPSLYPSHCQGKPVIDRHAQCWPAEAETLDFVFPNSSTKPETVLVSIT